MRASSIQEALSTGGIATSAAQQELSMSLHVRGFNRKRPGQSVQVPSEIGDLQSRNWGSKYIAALVFAYFDTVLN